VLVDFLDNEVGAKITEDEFRDAVTRHNAWARKVVYSSLVAGLVLWPLVLQVGFLAGQRLSEGRARDCVAVAMLTYPLACVLFVGGSVAIWCHEYRSKSDPRLVCPRCRRALPQYTEPVLATGKCPFCGGRVLDYSRKSKKQLWSDDEL
jgi:hypothetical protein